MKSTLVLQVHTVLIALLACFATLWQPCAVHASASTPAAAAWDAPAAQLATQIAAILGPGQVQIELTNRSSIPASNLAAIRTFVEDALRSHGIHSGSSESANTVRITLSENNRESLWVAEILEGNQHQVTMVHFEKPHAASVTSSSGITLERKLLWSSADVTSASSNASPILAALEWNNSLVLLTEDHLLLFTRAADGWTEAIHQPLNRPTGASHSMPREPRGELVLDTTSTTITAYLPGLRCISPLLNAQLPGANVNNATCTASDDPWPLTSEPLSSGTSTAQKAFYNTVRNYFTGVMTPGLGIDLPPFYTAMPLPLSQELMPSMLLTGIDGKPRLATASGIKPLIGARDWGSDLATLTTSCGNTAIIVSNSGETPLDSLRAYDLRGNEATAVSEPLLLKGSVMAMIPAPYSTSDSASLSAILAIVRIGTQDYEVDRVSALCQ